MNKKESEESQSLILGRFIRQHLIEPGSIYSKYLIKDVFGGERAQIKVQPQSEIRPTVLHEAGFLQQLQGYPGFPLMIWSGYFNKQEMGVITEKLGYDLEELRLAATQKCFSLATVCLVGLQLIKILEILHDKHTLLECISPHVFRLNPRQVEQLTLSSMFYCKRYRSYKTLQIYKMKKVENLDFFNLFASRNKLEGFSTARRDDLQSMFYLLVYLLRGKLPWSHLESGNKKESINLLVRAHQSLRSQSGQVREELLGDLPPEFISIFQHIESLPFQERPNYSLIRLKLKKLLAKLQLKQQITLDWIEYLPRMRKQLTKPNDLNFYTLRDGRSMQKYYDPFQSKLQVDNLMGYGIYKPQHNGNANGLGPMRRVRHKSHCQLI